MATIDLMTHQLIATAATEDPVTSTVTVNFTDGSTLNLGSLRIETSKYRALIESLALTAKALYPDSPLQPHYVKTSVDLGAKSSTVQF